MTRDQRTCIKMYKNKLYLNVNYTMTENFSRGLYTFRS